jgi:hypothetical protein
MTKPSVKQQLLAQLAERVKRERNPSLRAYYANAYAALNARGSGALPSWARHMAKDWLGV